MKNMKAGDLVFFKGSSFFSKLIQGVTGGRFSHVAIAFSSNEILEAGAHRGSVVFTNILEFESSGMTITTLRLKPRWLARETRRTIPALCMKYYGAPYSYWDCVTNLICRPLPAKWREKATATLGNKKFMKCDELVQRVLWEATGYPGFKNYESLTPSDLYNRCVKSGHFEEVK